jgi:homoserine dehydrogenase
MESSMPRSYNLCIVGFGNVGQELVHLLDAKRNELRESENIEFQVTGIASRALGWIANLNGVDMRGPHSTAANVRDWLAQAKADVLFEATSLNRHDGQPAVDHIRAALECGAHAISANKGPVVFAYRELRDLARAQHRQFFFESTVLDGVPIFSLFRDAMPVARVQAFSGVLNSTTNVVLQQIEAGHSLEDAVTIAQQLGVAETDPTDDLEGWDAAVKVAALATVLFDQPISLDQVQRKGITSLDSDAVREARRSGHAYKLVCRARKLVDGMEASVQPEKLSINDPMARVDGTSSIVTFEMDVLPALTMIEHDPGLRITAYGMLADFVRAVREEGRS